MLIQSYYSGPIAGVRFAAYSVSMDHWRSCIELSRPFWEDYRDPLLRLNGESFPGVRKLNALLPAGLCSKGERPIAFVPANKLPGVAYEKHIF